MQVKVRLAVADRCQVEVSDVSLFCYMVLYERRGLQQLFERSRRCEEVLLVWRRMN
jgi:hypothetical protein